MSQLTVTMCIVHCAPNYTSVVRIDQDRAVAAAADVQYVSTVMAPVKHSQNARTFGTILSGETSAAATLS